MKSKKEQNPFKILNDWELKSKLLRRRFPQLTQSDLTVENEDEISMLEKISKRLNKEKTEVIQIIKNTITNKFINNLKINYHE